MHNAMELTCSLAGRAGQHELPVHVLCGSAVHINYHQSIFDYSRCGKSSYVTCALAANAWIMTWHRRWSLRPP